MYNKSVKQVLKLPKNTNQNKVDKILGVQNAKNIVYSSFVRNFKLWDREFVNDEDKTDQEEGINKHINRLEFNIERDLDYPNE